MDSARFEDHRLRQVDAEGVQPEGVQVRGDSPRAATKIGDRATSVRLHELDESLLGFDGGNLVARAAVNRYVANHTNWTSKGMYAAIEKLTDFAVERLRSHLDLHPLDEGSP